MRISFYSNVTLPVVPCSFIYYIFTLIHGDPHSNRDFHNQVTLKKTVFKFCPSFLPLGPLSYGIESNKCPAGPVHQECNACNGLEKQQWELVRDGGEHVVR